ncbi:MAG: glycosyltransferase family 39 protein [Candidatus Riflebacteria bacterium]
MKKSLIILVISSIVALGLGFLPEESFRVSAYQNSAWYFMFVAFLMLVFSIYNSEHSLCLVESCRTNARAAGFAAIIVVAGFFLSPPEFRILADETNLLGVSMEMNDTTRCVLPVESLYYYHGMRTVITEKTEMRPPAYPFVLSLLHGISGYRPANAFILNAISAWLALFLLFLMVTRREGGLWGYVAMVAMASYPVFVQYFTSAGFETFNLALLMLCFFLLDRFLETRNLWISVAVVASLILLAHSRYESITTVLCILPLLLNFLPENALDDWREKLIFAFPIFLLPALWLRTATWDAVRFQVETVDRAFSLEYLWPNFKGMVMFFLSGRSQRFAGPILTVMACVGLILLLEKWFNNKLVKEQRWFNAALAARTVFHLFARLLYVNGDLAQPHTARLAIVFLPLIAALAVSGLRRIETFKSPVNIAPGILLLMFALLISCWPVAAANDGAGRLLEYREFKWAREVFERHQVGEESILIVNRPNLYVPFKKSAITFSTAYLMQERLEKMLYNHSYSRLIILQHINYRKGEAEEDLPLNIQRFKSRILFESQLSTSHYLRISEISL